MTNDIEQLQSLLEQLNKQIPKVLEDIKCLKEDLEQFSNPKNWTRPYNYKGELINEHALYRPKLKGT